MFFPRNTTIHTTTRVSLWGDAVPGGGGENQRVVVTFHRLYQVHLLIMVPEHPWIGDGCSKLFWCLGAAASVVGAVHVLKMLRKTRKPQALPSPSSPLPRSPPPLLSPPLPPYSRDDANLLCPSLVIMSQNPSGDLKLSNECLRGSGFIVKSEGKITTVWGTSWFLYDSDTYRVEGLKKLAPGKIVVVPQYPTLCEKAFEGIVVHVDFAFDLAVIKFEDPDDHYKPTAHLGSPMDFSVPYIGLDFYSYFSVPYIAEPCYFRDVDEFGKRGMCGDYLHVEIDVRSSEGAILNSQKDVVGMKVLICDKNRKHAHVLSMSTVSQVLGLYMDRRFSSDIRLSSGEKMEIEPQPGDGDSPVQ